MGKKKELGKDSMGIQKTMRFGDFFGDGIGQLPLNAMSGLIGQLTYFYTEKIGLAAAAVATMLIIAKVMDAFSDLLMGKVMDSMNNKEGKCKPWFKWMSLPTAIIIVLLFTVPKNAASPLQLAYVLVTNVICTAIIYTAVAIPYGAVMALRTKSSEERGKMGIFRAIFGYIAGMIIAVLLIPLTNMMGGDQKAWIIVAAIFAALSFLSLIILYRHTKEVSDDDAQTPAQAEEEKLPFKEEIAILFKNKYWVLMLLANLFMNLSYGLSTSGGTYYAKYILGDDNIVALLGAVGLIPTFLGFILVGPLTKKFGMAKTCFIGCLIGIIGCVGRVFVPYSLMGCLIGGGMATFANIPTMCLSGAMVNNCVEYNDWKFGKKLIGMSNSASSFGCKIGSGIGGSLIGWILGACGFISGAAVAEQPAAVTGGIFAFAIYIPLVLLVIMAILFKMYDLEKIYPQIMADLEARNK